MAGCGDHLAELRPPNALPVADIAKLISASQFAHPNGWTILVSVATGSAGVAHADHPIFRHGIDAAPNLTASILQKRAKQFVNSWKTVVIGYRRTVKRWVSSFAPDDHLAARRILLSPVSASDEAYR
jgi:hypothetical protein